MFVLVLLFILITAISIKLQRERRGLQQKMMLAVAGDDSDMKIVPPSGMRTPPKDEGELAAMEFVTQKKNGNIQKAYALGDKIAALLFAENGPVLTLCEISDQPEIRLQRKVLFSFVTNAVLNAGLPSILAETAFQEISSQIRQTDPLLHEQINDSKTLSFYLLCGNGKGQFEQIGEAFARLCGKKDDQQMIQLGENLFHAYEKLCRQMIEETQFCQ